MAPNRGASNLTTSSKSSAVRRRAFVVVGRRPVGSADSAHHRGQPAVGEAHPLVDRPTGGRRVEHRCATVTGKHVGEVLGDRSSDPLTLKPGSSGDEADPSELAVGIRHATAGSRRRRLRVRPRPTHPVAPRQSGRRWYETTTCRTPAASRRPSPRESPALRPGRPVSASRRPIVTAHDPCGVSHAHLGASKHSTRSRSGRATARDEPGPLIAVFECVT